MRDLRMAYFKAYWSKFFFKKFYFYTIGILLVVCFFFSCRVGDFFTSDSDSSPTDNHETVIFASAKEGCLAEKIDENRQTRTNFAPDSVWIETKNNSIIAHQHIIHNCCHRAVINDEASGKHLTVTTSLNGELCRCMCESDLDYTFGNLSRGTWSLTVLVLTDSKEDTVYTREVAVQ